MTTQPPLPKLTYACDTHGYVHGYALVGWDDFYRYARLSWPMWERLAADTESLTEIDALRIMLAAYATEHEHLKREHADYVARNPEQVIHVDGHVYRYVGP